MKNSEKSSSNNNNNNNNNVTSDNQKELLTKVAEAAKKLTTKGEAITGEAVVKQLGGAPWSYDTSKVTAESGKIYTRRYIQHNGVDVVRIDNVSKLLDGDYVPTKRGRRAAAPKTKVQELECIIDNLCTFAAEVEGEAHEAEAFRKNLYASNIIIGLRMIAEVLDVKAQKAAEAEAARMAAVEEQKKTIEGLATLPHLIPQYIEGIINNDTFVYDSCFDKYLSPEQKAKYKPAEAEAEADNEPAAEGDNNNEPAEAAEGAKVEATEKATTAKGKGSKTA